MNSLKSNKTSAVILTAAILFVTVFSMSVFANAASDYSPRLSPPSSTDKYYYSDINIFYKYDCGMPNCTAYAFGRAYEILGSEPKLSHGDAQDWYGYNKANGYYKYGSTPKLGAIACWEYDNGGHVAVVEKIENGIITFSNSAWGGDDFYLTTASVNNPNEGGNSWWSFQGYIYIGEFDSGQPSTEDNHYSAGIYRTNVDDSLNMRSGAGTGFSYLASIPNDVELNVTEVKQNDGYHWGHTSYKGNDGWVALEYCDYIKPLPTNPISSTPAATSQLITTQPVSSQNFTEPSTSAHTAASSAGLGMGDVNSDGKIDILDVTLIQKHLAKIEILSEPELALCDFDLDGDISIIDATAIQKFIAGIFQ